MSRARQLERDEVEDQIDVRRQMNQEDQDAIDEMDEWMREHYPYDEFDDWCIS